VAVPVGQLPALSGCEEGWCRVHLHAHGVWAAHRHVGMRSYWCRAQRRVWRLLSRSTGRWVSL